MTRSLSNLCSHFCELHSSNNCSHLVLTACFDQGNARRQNSVSEGNVNYTSNARAHEWKCVSDRKSIFVHLAYRAETNINDSQSVYFVFPLLPVATVPITCSLLALINAVQGCKAVYIKETAFTQAVCRFLSDSAF